MAETQTKTLTVSCELSTQKILGVFFFVFSYLRKLPTYKR